MQLLPFHLVLPDRPSSSAIFASPHSGRDYPWSFIRASQLDEKTIRSSEDAFVDQLFAHAPQCGAPLLAASAPRAYVDLNRSADELDPALIYGVKQSGHNPRLSSGLGVIPRVVAGGREIRSGKITHFEAQSRLEQHYFPYHQKLQTLIDQSLALHGHALLFDCHSMPHDALVSTNYGSAPTPDVVLGDRYGVSCNQDIVVEVEQILTGAGLKTARNLPFAGAYVAQHYGRPVAGRHVLQIEIDRAIYMDEESIQPNENFTAFKELLSGVIQKFVVLGQQDIRLAAE